MKIKNIFNIMSFGFFGEIYVSTLNTTEINLQTTEEHIEEINNDVKIKAIKVEFDSHLSNGG